MIFLVSNVRRSFIKKLAATVSLILLIAAVPLAVNAQPAFTSVTMDRTTISSGQTVNFSVRTTSQAQFVFAMVDGNRVQGTRVAGNDWSVTVSPIRTTTVSIFANSTNDQVNAASFAVPITVTGTTTTTTTTNVTVQIPPAPANLGPITIASITETPATASGEVQLTIVTGVEANDVWVNFDRVNNARATGRFARATMLSQGTNSRTWVINFRPSAWATQQVEVGSNRTYNWPGASTQQYSLTLSQPFVAPVTPTINSVTVNPRNVTGGNTTTFTINTNLDVEHVWIRDADGREHNAHRTTSSAHARTWAVTFNPIRTGSVTVFANATRTETNAATRTESISVNQGSATIIGTPAISWLSGNQTRITVTTNSLTETVWAVMPGTNNRVALRRTNSGTGNRTWSEDVWSSDPWGNITIGASSQTGNLNSLSAEDSRTVSNMSGNNNTGGIIQSIDHLSSSDREVRRNSSTEFLVRTSGDVNRFEVIGNHIDGINFRLNNTLSGSVQEWIITVFVAHNAPINQNLSLTLRAFSGNFQLDSRTMPSTMVRNN
jgi:hypothetical protein